MSSTQSKARGGMLLAGSLSFLLLCSAQAKNICSNLHLNHPTSSVSADELAMSGLLHQLHVLKGQQMTVENLEQMDNLNLKALDLVAAQLHRHHIAFRIVDPIHEPSGPFSRAEKKRLLIEAIEKLKRTGGNEKTIEDLQRRLSMVDNTSKPTGLPGTILEKPFIGQMQVQAKPYILILESPTNPPVMNAIIRRFRANLIISPHYKSLNPKILAAAFVEQSTIFLAIEDFFKPQFRLSGTLLHEITHLNLQLENNSLYGISVRAAQGEKIPGAVENFYDSSFSFQELSTWNKDLNYIDSAALGEYGKRTFIEGQVYESQNQAAFKEYTAIRLQGLAEVSLNIVDEILRQIRDEPQNIESGILPAPTLPDSKTSTLKKPTSVRLTIKKGDRDIAFITFPLAGLDKSPAGQKLEILKAYLMRVRERVEFHRTRAIEAQTGQPLQKPWVHIGGPPAELAVTE